MRSTHPPRAVPALEAFTIPATAAADWKAFLDVFRALRAATAEWPAELDLVDPVVRNRNCIACTTMRPCAKEISSSSHQIASTYPSRERFLTEMALDPPAATSDEAGVPGKDDDYLILSTIHSAKGQEWKAVHILNVVDGCIPSDMGTGTTEEMEEERRLLYVAMTRAKDDLQLIVPQRFYVHQQASYGDRHVYASRSRFIPDALLELFEAVGLAAGRARHGWSRRVEPCGSHGRHRGAHSGGVGMTGAIAIQRRRSRRARGTHRRCQSSSATASCRRRRGRTHRAGFRGT